MYSIKSDIEQRQKNNILQDVCHICFFYSFGKKNVKYIPPLFAF